MRYLFYVVACLGNGSVIVKNAVNFCCQKSVIPISFCKKTLKVVIFQKQYKNNEVRGNKKEKRIS